MLKNRWFKKYSWIEDIVLVFLIIIGSYFSYDYSQNTKWAQSKENNVNVQTTISIEPIDSLYYRYAKNQVIFHKDTILKVFFDRSKNI